jgi:hypothetical protein
MNSIERIGQIDSKALAPSDLDRARRKGRITVHRPSQQRKYRHH